MCLRSGFIDFPWLLVEWLEACHWMIRGLPLDDSRLIWWFELQEAWREEPDITPATPLPIFSQHNRGTTVIGMSF
jgi:hypothetical protein